ncbi:MAG: 50S ribosomal protein L17 [Minisyncoccales bacterium]
MKFKKLSRKVSLRKAVLKLLVQDLILKEKIITTEKKGKEAMKLLTFLIEKAKKKKESQRKTILKYLSGPALTKLIYQLPARYQERKGGYLRMIKLGRRLSDGAELCQLELIK